MAVNVTTYDNYFLANEIEDQYKSHLDLQQFCTVDNTLTGTAGMLKKIHRYKATDGTEKLGRGEGNTKTIGANFKELEYRIQLAQNNFQYYDEDALTDPIVVQTGIRHMGTDMFNTVNGDIYDEFNKATLTLSATNYGFDVFADAVALLDLKETDNDPAVVAPRTFAFINPADAAKVRKALKDELKYVEAFARTGYIGTVAGVNLYVKKDAIAGTCILATKEAVTIFNKTGVEVEQPPRSFDEANVRVNSIFSRKYYVVALTDETKVVKITIA